MGKENPFLTFVRNLEQGLADAGNYAVSARRTPVRDGPAVLLFSPHPDDECITGLLPLRLMHEAGRRIINVPVTFGSDIARRPGRSAELQAACDYLGFGIHRVSDELLPLTAGEVQAALEAYRPEAVFVPHASDWNSGHEATHRLVIEAFQRMAPDFSCHVVETEFWQPMENPNLLVEGSAEQVAELMAATSLHVEEVARNPYHLLLPAWMQDNVRRGSERVGGEGGPAFGFSFASIYRVRHWLNGGFVSDAGMGAAISLKDNPAGFLNGLKKNGA